MEILYIVPALITYIVGYILIKYPISISVPTERGMHKYNIASSGGIAILIGIISYRLLSEFVDVPWHVWEAPDVVLVLMFIIFSIIGYIDDKNAISKAFRFGTQILVSYFIVEEYTAFRPILTFFAVFLMVYTINIYNFMDGIDQLAISQAIFFSIGSALLSLGNSFVFSLIFISFFLLNYKKTKIFLGNSGSYLLGLYVAVVIVLAHRLNVNDEQILIVMLILMTTFYIDATYALIIRFKNQIFSGATISESIKHVTQQAHRTHAYQNLACKMNSHSKVVFLMMLYNYLWCLPLAYITYRYDYFLVPVLLSYMPYIYYCYLNKSGTES